jgi:hypothetical protein
MEPSSTSSSAREAAGWRVSARSITHREALLMLAFCCNWLQARDEGLKCLHRAPIKDSELRRIAACRGIFDRKTLAAANMLQRSCESAMMPCLAF